jgi:redox-sensing transcriptional repressor
VIPERNVERLSLYRCLLVELANEGFVTVSSHVLAARGKGTAAQVRRDLMAVDYRCSSTRGYDVHALTRALTVFLDGPDGERVALVGIGNLGRALLDHFNAVGPHLRVVAAFDSDPARTGKVIHGCRCYGSDEMGRIIREQSIQVAMIAVPASGAQKLAERLVECGVRGILNFAPIPLHVPPGVFIERIDMTMALEKVAFFSRVALQGGE